MPLHHLSLSETLETLGQMWNSSSGLSKEIWVLLAGGMLGLNRRSVNKDNCGGSMEEREQQQVGDSRKRI